MSFAALLVRVRNILRDNLSDLLPPEHILIMPDGRPAPACGDRFIAIHATSWRPRPGDDDMNRGLSELFDFDCTITYRTPFIPQESIGDEIFLKSLEGMEALCRLIIICIHQNIDLLGLDEDGELLEYPRWAGTSLPTPVGPDWFYSSPDQGEGFEYIQSGLTMTVSFRDAHRMQTYEDME